MGKWQYIHLFNLGGRNIKIYGSIYRKDRTLIIREWLSFALCILFYCSIIGLNGVLKPGNLLSGLSYLAALICTVFIRYIILPKDMEKYLHKIEKGE